MKLGRKVVESLLRAIACLATLSIAVSSTGHSGNSDILDGKKLTVLVAFDCELPMPLRQKEIISRIQSDLQADLGKFIEIYVRKDQESYDRYKNNKFLAAMNECKQEAVYLSSGLANAILNGEIRRAHEFIRLLNANMEKLVEAEKAYQRNYSTLNLPPLFIGLVICEAYCWLKADIPPRIRCIRLGGVTRVHDPWSRIITGDIEKIFPVSISMWAVSAFTVAAKETGYNKEIRPKLMLQYISTMAKHEIGNVFGLDIIPLQDAELSEVMRAGYVYGIGEHFRVFRRPVHYTEEQLKIIEGKLVELAKEIRKE